MFGKQLSEYLGFQKLILAITAAVGLVRLGLSLGGLPNGTVTFLSITVVGFAAAVYYGVSVCRSGFGSYKQLLPLAIFQAVVMHAVSVFGILLTIAGMPNIFAAPEYSGPAVTNQWLHIAAHLTIGMIALPLVLWAVASLTMLITKRVAPSPAVT